MEIINIGDDVYCDFCNSDGEDSYGGVLIGSNAVCGHCCEYQDIVSQMEIA